MILFALMHFIYSINKQTRSDSIFKISLKKKELPSIEEEIYARMSNVNPLILRAKRLHTDDKARYDTLI